MELLSNVVVICLCASLLVFAAACLFTGPSELPCNAVALWPIHFAKTMHIPAGRITTAMASVYIVEPSVWPLGGYEVHEMRGKHVVASTPAFDSFDDAAACARRLNMLGLYETMPKPKPLQRTGAWAPAVA
jgi:hypothetical protein